jgi:hypothetical protein
MDLREIGWNGMDRITLAQDRDQWRVLPNTVMNFRVPWNAGKFLSSCIISDFSRMAQLHEWVSEWVSEPIDVLRKKKLNKLSTSYPLITAVRRSWWSMAEDDPDSRSLLIIDVGSVVDVSEIYAIRIFRAEVSRMSECSCIYWFLFVPHGCEQWCRRFGGFC